MDPTSLLQMSGVSVSTFAIVYIIYKSIQLCINHRVVSDCCGRRGSIGISVTEMKGNSPVSSYYITLDELEAKTKSDEVVNVTISDTLQQPNEPSVG